MTTAARSRHSAGTRITASGDGPAAQTSTASAPRPRDQASTCSVVSVTPFVEREHAGPPRRPSRG